jgi:hypothetical protein
MRLRPFERIEVEDLPPREHAALASVARGVPVEATANRPPTTDLAITIEELRRACGLLGPCDETRSREVRRFRLAREKRALPPALRRHQPRTTSERADRPRADFCFAMPEQSSEEAAPAQLVLVQGERGGSTARALAASRMQASCA